MITFVSSSFVFFLYFYVERSVNKVLFLVEVLAEKLPELLDFHKDLFSVEHAVKVMLLVGSGARNFGWHKLPQTLICVDL